MRLLSITTIIIFLFYIPSAFADETKDIKGWNNARWGMTKSELQKIFKAESLKFIKRQYLDENTVYREMEILNYSIDGSSFTVVFEMSAKDDKLKRIRLIRRNALASDFGKFERLLSNKYGQAIQKDQSSDHHIGTFDKNASWSLPTTKIELIYSVIGGFGSVLNIIYSDQLFSDDASSKL